MRHRDRTRTRLRWLAAGMLAAALTCGWPPTPARAVTPDEILVDPGLEARARTLSRKLRCVVCQNQSIDDSSAPLARDLRVIVRERLQAGDSDDQALGFIVARYGNFVLLQPPLQTNTALLWLGPALMLLAAMACVGTYLRQTRRRLEAASGRPDPEPVPKPDTTLASGHSP